MVNSYRYRCGFFLCQYKLCMNILTLWWQGQICLYVIIPNSLDFMAKPKLWIASPSAVSHDAFAHYIMTTIILTVKKELSPIILNNPTPVLCDNGIKVNDPLGCSWAWHRGQDSIENVVESVELVRGSIQFTHQLFPLLN